MKAIAESHGVYIPRILAACLAIWALLDIGLRFMPLDRLHILPEHIATRHPAKYAPFIPNLTLRYDPWVGETAMTGNVKPIETRPPIQFSTDSLGFRLTPGVPPDGKVDALLFAGASFAYGGGLSDDETFPAVFTRQTNLRMYNGGHFYWDPQGLDALDWLLANLGGQRPAIVLLEWEQFDHDRAQLDGLPWRVDAQGAALLGQNRYREFRTDVQYAKRYLTSLWTVSPIEIGSIRFFKAIANDRVLPNPYKESIAARSLGDGRRLLMLKDEVNRVLHAPSENQTRQHADYFAYFRKRLAERGLDMYVVLVPNKYTLYGSVIDNIGIEPGKAYLDRLEIELLRRNVKTVNGLTALRTGVAGEIASGDLSLYREDHHWNPKGAARLASVLASRFQADGKLTRTVEAHAIQ